MSGATVPYHLRQNKHVERELFIELLSHIDRVRPIRDYLYVGFGGVFFEDFKLLHAHFGADNLLSLEQEKWVHERQVFNQPYGSISCVHMASSAFIAGFAEIRGGFPKAKNVLCWLDYASPKEMRQQLEEFRGLLPKLTHYDIVKITVNANPSTLWSRDERGHISSDELKANRLAVLRERIGDMLPEGISENDVTVDNYPSLLLRVIERVSAEAIVESPGSIFQPLGNYRYNDYQHTMLTMTGILLPISGAKRFISSTKLRRFPFAGLNSELIRINVPYLSPREKLTLDKTMFAVEPDAMAEELKFQFDKDSSTSAEMVAEYRRFHRFYPHYHRIQY